MMHGLGFGGIGGPHMMGGPLGAGWMVSGVMGIGFLVIVGLVIWLAVSASRQSGSSAGQHAAMPVQPSAYPQYAPQAVRPEDPAVAIARERFARGEIDRESYEAIINALRS